jgi:hypothetical protein
MKRKAKIKCIQIVLFVGDKFACQNRLLGVLDCPAIKSLSVGVRECGSVEWRRGGKVDEVGMEKRVGK